MRRSPLRRKTPLRSHSPKRREQMRFYNQEKEEYLRSHPRCQVQLDNCMGEAGQVHHMNGRNGSRLRDQTYWLPVCQNCHDYISSHRAWAEKHGYLYPLSGRILVS